MSKVKMAKRNDFWQRNRLSDGYLLKKTILNYALKILRFLLMFGLCFLILQPILNKISVSIMATKDIFDSTINVVPRNFSTENIRLTVYLMDYPSALTNSLLISLSISLVQLISCTLVGYGFARFNFPFKKFLFACVILVIVIPPQTISTSLYLHFRYFDIFGIVSLINGDTANLRGSAIPYYLMSVGCMGLKNGLYIYLIRQFFRGIPKELEEAAYVDGCGTLSTFFRIMLPDAKPILTSCFLFSFVWQWTDNFYSGMFLGKTKLLSTELESLADTLGNYLADGKGTQQVSVGYVQQINSIGTLLVVTPLILLYLVAQRGFVESLSQTGIKM